ncbi:hypothetical protein [Sinomonas humi]|uniref:Lipoprotein n=1 Tax=Sinomonas humi TaxID=1338436 RepID=A0A0B2APS9_9MICC|nr:hypothetical protein [Sinomonas humi]KHL05418.1 hypothetical protein LK10_01435 [Sinomonas humi]
MPLGGSAAGLGTGKMCCALGLLLASTAALSACAYSYDDGLPPLGERSTPSSAPSPLAFERVPPPPASDPPLRDWTSDMVASWAEAALPDNRGLSFGFGFGMVLQGEPVLASTVVPGGTFTIEYECRGGPAFHLALQLGATPIIDGDYACGQMWAKTFVAPQDGVAEVTASAAGGNAAAYAFRVVKR